jgi:hypothetical protein
VEHGDGIGGEELLGAADGAETHADIVSGVARGQRLDKQAISEARVERAIAAAREAGVHASLRRTSRKL